MVHVTNIMKSKISKKRILLALLPLIIFNIAVAFNVFFFGSTAWSQEKSPYEWGLDDRLYTNKTSQKIGSDEESPLFGYEGEDANCWEMEKSWQRDKCMAEHPYGGQGTMTLGGNLLINGAQALYLNGHDSAWYNWMMTTSTEVFGNALATRGGENTDVLYGNNLLADGTMTSGRVNFEAASSSVFFMQGEMDGNMAASGEIIDKVMYTNMIGDKVANVFQILGECVCGMCDGVCGAGKAGIGYTFVAGSGLEVKENLKVNDQMRFCGVVESCEEACCRELKYLADDTWDNFVGSDCTGVGSCSGGYCYPQPYPHYTVTTANPNIPNAYTTDSYGYTVKTGGSTAISWTTWYDSSGGGGGGGSSGGSGGGGGGVFTPGTNPGWHHYNPTAWHGKGSAIVFCNDSPDYASCTIGGHTLKYHGLDKGRQVWTDHNTTHLGGTVKCTGKNGQSFSTSVSGSGSSIIYGGC